MFTELIKDSLAVIKESVGVVAAVVSLGSALIVYRVNNNKAIANLEATSILRKIETTDVRQKPWDIRRYKWVAALGALPALIVGITGFETLGPVLSIVDIVMGLGLIVLIAFIRTVPPSRTRKSTRLELQLPSEKAMELCLRATSGLGAQVAKYDAAAGILIAKTDLSWRSFGEIITVEATTLDQRQCQVEIQSDLVLVSSLTDWGANKRNVKRIQSALLNVAPSAK
jgi:hypothetical protein